MPIILHPLETDLLSAAFLPHPDARVAWRRWRDSIDWDRHIDPEAFALLPAVYRNLQGLGADDPLFPRFKGIARQGWLANQRRIVGLKDTLEECARNGVDLLLLPPVSRWLHDPSAILGQRHYLQWAVRPGQAEQAIRCFLRVGWRVAGVRLPPRLIPGYVLGTRHLRLESSAGEAATLTWGLEWWFGARTGEAWRRASSRRLGKQPVLGLDRTDALEFSLRHPSGSGLGQVADMLVIAAEPGAIDWRRLDSDLERHPLPQAREALLAPLQPFFDALGAPPGLARRCGEAPPPPLQAPTPSTPLGRCRQDWDNYRRAWGAGYRPATAWVQLPGYLMARWRLADPWQIPKGLGARLRWKIHR